MRNRTAKNGEKKADETRAPTNSERAVQIADRAREYARSLGASDVIVMVGVTNAPGEPPMAPESYHVTWFGRGLSVRGLLEICVDTMRQTLRGSP